MNDNKDIFESTAEKLLKKISLNAQPSGELTRTTQLLIAILVLVLIQIFFTDREKVTVNNNVSYAVAKP